ncbi:MAG: hypothetical protein L0Y56_14680 [Nitrospira sp.]|nr:hypothetical protein [Nitrospira sp.]
MKKNILAAALSAILPGAGQLYNHQWLKGIGFLTAVLVISASMRRRMILAEPSLIAMLVVITLFAIAIWSVVDAYRSTRVT